MFLLEVTRFEDADINGCFYSLLAYKVCSNIMNVRNIATSFETSLGFSMNRCLKKKNEKPLMIVFNF